MKRKMVLIGISYAFGLFFAFSVPDQFDITVVAAAFAGYGIYYFYDAGFRFQKALLCRLLLSLTTLMLGFSAFRLYTDWVYEPIAELDGTTLSLSGEITEYSDYAGDTACYTVQTTLRGRKTTVVCWADSVPCAYGDRLNVMVKLSLPDSDFVYDSLAYYRSNGIFLEANALSAPLIYHTDTHWLVREIHNWKEYAKSNLSAAMSPSGTGLLSAMLFGDKSMLTAQEKDLLFQVGIGHVTAVSGLHLVFLCGLLQLVLDWFHLQKWLRFFLSEIAMLLVMICVGWSVSVRRAAIMMTLVCAAPLFHRKQDTLNSLSAAILFMTLRQPYLISNPSFLLSVAGVFGIGVAAPWLTKHWNCRHSVGKALLPVVQLFVVSVCVFPISIVCFGESSLVSPITNLILVPLCMATMTCGLAGVFLCGTPLAFPAFWFADVFCMAVFRAAYYIAQLPWSSVSLHTETVRAVVLILTAFILLSYLLFRRRAATVCAFFLSVCILIGTVRLENLYNQGVLKIALIGTSSQYAIVASQGASACVLDFSETNQNAESVAVYLQQEGISEIRLLALQNAVYAKTAAYETELVSFDVQQVYLSRQERFRTVCGCAPTVSQPFQFSTEAELPFTLRVEQEAIWIQTDAFSFCCSDTVPEQQVTVLFQESLPASASVECSYWIVANEPKGGAEDILFLENSNLQIMIASDGAVFIELF